MARFRRRTTRFVTAALSTVALSTFALSTVAEVRPRTYARRAPDPTKDRNLAGFGPSTETLTHCAEPEIARPAQAHGRYGVG